MPNTAKTVTAVIIVLLVAGGGYYWYTHMPSQTGSYATAQQNSGEATTATAVASLPGGTSDSDASLNSDTAAIDAQMNGLNTDNTDTNSSINDQPISQ